MASRGGGHRPPTTKFYILNYLFDKGFVFTVIRSMAIAARHPWHNENGRKVCRFLSLRAFFSLLLCFSADYIPWESFVVFRLNAIDRQ